jgi:acetate kinase
VRAAEALDLFCYQAKKWIGAYAAALGGVDTLVFAGGIGENSPIIRERICADLGFLGIKLHRSRNAKNAALISTDAAPVAVRVIRTDEELMIARSVMRVCAATLPRNAAVKPDSSPPENLPATRRDPHHADRRVSAPREA